MLAGLRCSVCCVVVVVPVFACGGGGVLLFCLVFTVAHNNNENNKTNKSAKSKQEAQQEQREVTTKSRHLICFIHILCFFFSPLVSLFHNSLSTNFSFVCDVCFELYLLLFVVFLCLPALIDKLS